MPESVEHRMGRRNAVRPFTRFGAVLRARRMDSADPMTMDEAALRWDVTKSTINRWDKGRPPDALNFVRVCRILGMEPSEALLDVVTPGEDVAQYYSMPTTRADEAVLAIRKDLQAILLTDKTLPYTMGEPDNRGNMPADGATWLTPRRLAERALEVIDAVVGDRGKAHSN